MLTINRNSWHFKLLSRKRKIIASNRSDTGSLSLCTYFWMVMTELLIYARDIILFTAICYVAGFLLYIIGYVWYFTIAYGMFDVMTFDINAIELSIALHVLGLAYALTCAFFYYSINFVQWLYRIERPKKQPNILTEYVKAKKQRICPMIRIEE